VNIVVVGGGCWVGGGEWWWRDEVESQWRREFTETFVVETVRIGVCLLIVQGR
jgi:hypothetical protein